MDVILILLFCLKFVFILELSVVVIFMLLLLIGNFIVCLVIFCKRFLRMVLNYFLLNLVIVDIFSVVISFFLLVFVFISGKWMFFRSVC